MKRFWLLSLTLPLFITAHAQSEDCQIHLAIIDTHYVSHATNEQMKWWIKDGQRKYKNVCLVSTPKDADYVLMWAERWRDYHDEISVPKTTTTQQSGTIDTQSSNGTSTSGTYHGTSTTTTQEKEPFDYTVQRVSAALYRATMLGNGRHEVVAGSMPIFISNHKGQMRWSKPDKDVLVDALRFITKQQR